MSRGPAAMPSHVVLFSFNPAWRSQTHGSYFFIFNALLNWKDLGAKPK